MNIEKKISEVVQKQMDDGVIEEAVKKHFQSCVDRVVRDLFSYDGIVYESIQNQVKSTIVPFLEGYDYSRYVVKLDAVMTEILKNTTFENRMALDNFKNLMTTEKIEKITMSELFKKYCDFCKGHINDYNLEDDYIKEITCSFEFEEIDTTSNFFEKGRVVFECEENDDFKFEIELSRYILSKHNHWDIRGSMDFLNLKNLRYLNDFEVLLLRLSQIDKVLILDNESDCEEICLYEEE